MKYIYFARVSTEEEKGSKTIDLQVEETKEFIADYKDLILNDEHRR